MTDTMFNSTALHAGFFELPICLLRTTRMPWWMSSYSSRSLHMDVWSLQWWRSM